MTTQQQTTSFSFIWLSIEVKHISAEADLFPLTSGGRCDIKLGHKRDQPRTDHIGAPNGVKVKSLLSCCSHTDLPRHMGLPISPKNHHHSFINREEIIAVSIITDGKVAHNRLWLRSTWRSKNKERWLYSSRFPTPCHTLVYKFPMFICTVAALTSLSLLPITQKKM